MGSGRGHTRAAFRKSLVLLVFTLAALGSSPIRILSPLSTLDRSMRGDVTRHDDCIASWDSDSVGPARSTNECLLDFVNRHLHIVLADLGFDRATDRWRVSGPKHTQRAWSGDHDERLGFSAR